MKNKAFKIFFIWFILLFLFLCTITKALTIYRRTGFTGGTSTDLDGIDGDDLVESQIGLVFRDANSTETLYIYRVNASSGAAESVPDVIAPDTNPGSKRWILQKVYLNALNGLTSSVAELNILDGVTATGAEINTTCDGAAAKNSHTHITTEIDKVTADPNEINVLDGITASTAELNIMDGVTLTAEQINAAGGGTYNSRGMILGDATAGRVIRNVLITMDGHTDPNTVEIYLRNDGTFNFNGDTATAAHINKNQTLTDYSFDADGTAIYVLDAAISGTILGILSCSVIYDSSDLTYTTLYVDIDSNNMRIKFYNVNTATDIGNIGNAKAVHLSVTYITSE